MLATFDSLSDLLAELDRVRLALVTAADLRQIKDFRDRAEAIRRHAKAAGLGLEMQNQAAELKLVAERRAGRLLGDIPLHGGDRKSGHGDEIRLKKLGISQNASSRWQREASLPEQDFQQYLQQTKDTGKVPTSQDLLGLARVHAREMGARENLFPKLVNGLEKLRGRGRSSAAST